VDLAVFLWGLPRSNRAEAIPSIGQLWLSMITIPDDNDGCSSKSNEINKKIKSK
jgi:hypothetical protein